MSLPYLQPYLGLSNGLNTLHGGAAGGAVGGWVELGRTTLGSAGDTISVGSLADKRYYMILGNTIATGEIRQMMRFNSDSGTNYAYRGTGNGGADFTSTSRTNMPMEQYNETVMEFSVSYAANYSTKEKLLLGHTSAINTAGAGTAPDRTEFVNKHAQTSNPISTISLNNPEHGDYASGSEVVVLGWDPLDSHTNNFWEELYSGSGDAGMDTGVSGFSARKYLWIQMYLNDMISGANVNMVLNGVESSNYALRYNQNGGADGTITSRSDNLIHLGASNETEAFINMFIINDGSNEKLGIVHNMTQQTAGATTAPARSELVFKDSQTTQITDVEVRRSSGSWGANSQLKIWGAN